jgi:hypothetical protein
MKVRDPSAPGFLSLCQRKGERKARASGSRLQP